MNYFWAKFRTDKYFLAIYLSLQLLFFSLLNSIIYYGDLSPKFQFESTPYYLFFIAFILGVKIPTIMHNCFHDNLKKFSLLIGELTSFFVLMGFGIMCINHTFHHAFADSESDPHNPEGKSFLFFFVSSIFSGVSIIEKKHLDFHGWDFKNKLIFKYNILIHYLGMPARLFTWYLIMGKELFLFLYVPAFFVYLFSFAHVNYVTHAKNEDGAVVILNMNDGFWYKLVNFLGDGVYFHKNHHIKPNLYNPKNI